MNLASWGSIRNLVLSIPGYTPEQELSVLYLASMLTSSIEGDIVEIGSWCGRSAIALSAGTNNAKIHCIDLFLNKDDWFQNSDGTWSSECKLSDNKLLKSHISPAVSASVYMDKIASIYTDNPNMLSMFQRNIAKAKKSNVVIPHKGTSTTWGASMPADFKCRLAFIDGGHSYEEVCTDIKNVEKFLVPGGWILFDDVYTGFTGVDNAVHELIIDNPNYENVHYEIERVLIASKRKDPLILS